MKTCDLTSGVKKLTRALESLRVINAELEQLWSDEANRKFQEIYLAPLEPKVDNLLESTQRLAEVLASAERQCGII